MNDNCWGNPDAFSMVLRCTKMRYARTFLNCGQIKFSTPSSWVEYEEKYGDGRGDRLEGTMATFNIWDFENSLLADEWRLFVHYALHGALSLGARLNFGLTRGEQPETGDVVNAVVQTVIRSFALVEFTHNGESYLGQIHISEFTKLGYGYIRNLSEIVHIDDEYRTALLDYHEKYERWNLQIIPQELE